MDDTFPFPGKPGPSARAVRLTIPKDQAALLSRSAAWITSPNASSGKPRTANLPASVVDSLKAHYRRTHGRRGTLKQAVESPKPQGSEGENVPSHALASTVAGATEEEGASVAAAPNEGVTESFQESNQEGAAKSSRAATQEVADVGDISLSFDDEHIESSPEQHVSSWTPSPDQCQRKPDGVTSIPSQPETPSKPQQQIAPPSSLDFEEELEVVAPRGVRDMTGAASRGAAAGVPSSSPKYTSTHPPPCGQGDHVMEDVESTPEEPAEVVAKPEAMEKPVPGRRRRRMQQPYFSSDSAIPHPAIYPGSRLATARIPPAKMNASDLDSSQASGRSPTPAAVSLGHGKRQNTRASDSGHDGEPLVKKPRISAEVIYETAHETSHGTTYNKTHDTLHSEIHKETHRLSLVESHGTPRGTPSETPHSALPSASPETTHDPSHEVTHDEIPRNASGVGPYDASLDAPREPCSEGSDRREILVPATPSASHPHLAITGRRTLHPVEHAKPYDVYTTQYPEYQGSVWDFMRACVCLNYMQQRDMLREFLYDDFIRAFQEEYPYYVVESGGNLPAQQWFNRLRGPVVYHDMVITRDTLQQVFRAYPEVHQGVENGDGSPSAYQTTRQSPVGNVPAADHRRGPAQESIQAITPAPRVRPGHAPYTAQPASRMASTTAVVSGKTPSTAPARQRVVRMDLEAVHNQGSPVSISSQAPLVIPATQPLEPSMHSSQVSGPVPAPGSQAQRTRATDHRAINPPTPYSAVAESPFKHRTPLDRPGSSNPAHGHAPNGTSTTPQDRTQDSPSTHGHPPSERSSQTGPASTEKGTRPSDPRVSPAVAGPVGNVQTDTPGHPDPPQTPTTVPPAVKTEESSPVLADIDDGRGRQSAGEEVPGQPASNGSPARDASRPVSSSSSSGEWAPAGPVVSSASKGAEGRRSRLVASRQFAEKDASARRSSNGSSARGAVGIAGRQLTGSSPQRETVVSPTTKGVEPRRSRPSVASRQSAEETPDRPASKGSSARDITSRASRQSTEPRPQGEMAMSPTNKDVESRRGRPSAASRQSAELTPDRPASKGSSARDAASRASRRSTESRRTGETETVRRSAAKDAEPRRARLSDSTGTRSPDLGVPVDPSRALSEKSRAGTHTPAQNRPVEEKLASKTRGEGTGRKHAKVEGGRVKKKKTSGDGKGGRKPRISRVEAMRIYIARKKAAESASTSPASKG